MEKALSFGKMMKISQSTNWTKDKPTDAISHYDNIRCQLRISNRKDFICDTDDTYDIELSLKFDFPLKNLKYQARNIKLYIT